MNSANHGAREMGFASLGGGETGEHDGVGFVKIYKISATQNTFYLGTEPFNR